MVRIYLNPVVLALVLSLLFTLASATVWVLLGRSWRATRGALALFLIWLATAGAIIQSGATSDTWTIDPTSKAGRVTLYRTGGGLQERTVDGVYYFTTAVLTTAAAAHNCTATGHAWLEVPTATAKHARLRDLRVTATLGAAVGADVTALYRGLVWSRFTFTGTASGAVLTPAKRITTDPASAANVRTAMTGMTVTLGAMGAHLVQFGFIDWTAVVTSGAPATFTLHESVARWSPLKDDDFIDLAPGEGVCFWQPDAGATTFRLVLSGAWDEYTP